MELVCVNNCGQILRSDIGLYEKLKYLYLFIYSESKKMAKKKEFYLTSKTYGQNIYMKAKNSPCREPKE